MKAVLKYICAFLLLASWATAQNNKAVDSLLNELRHLPDDTNKVNIYYTITELCDEEDVDKYALRGIGLAMKIHFKRGEASLNYNRAVVFKQKGKIEKALECLNWSLKLYEEVSYQSGVAICCNEIGSIYQNLDNNDMAMDYYRRALAINLKMHNSSELALNFNNIGMVYHHRHQPAQAVAYYQKSLALLKQLGDLQGVARALNNIGGVYDQAGDRKKALDYYTQSLEAIEKYPPSPGKAYALRNIAFVHYQNKDYKTAESYALQSLELARKFNYPVLIRNAGEALHQIYAAQGRFKEAYETEMLRRKMEEKVSNEEVQKASLQMEFEKKEELARAGQEKKDAMAEAEKKRQSLVTWAVSIGLVLVLIFSLLLLNRFNLIQRQKKVIEEQKQLVEGKNKDITDSINYAKRIQEAILPETGLKNKLFPEIFVLFQPRDIVSGDFYWFTGKNGKKIIAAADCTGHGVPGAFMSMIGNAFLNEIVNEKGITEPAKILDALRIHVITSLKQNDSDNKDGMDIALLAFDETSPAVEFAGANNPLWLVRNNAVTELKADKQPIGFQIGETSAFTNHTVTLQKGDMLYIFTDGYADQFGGPKAKKFKYQQMQSVILSVQGKSMAEQEETLLKKINEWKGEHEQVDDILVIGVRV